MTIYEWAERLGMDPHKSRGPEDFFAPCPVHRDGKNPNLHVRIGPQTGQIQMMCMSCGANGKAVCEALDLPLSEVMCDARTGEAMDRDAKAAPQKKAADKPKKRVYPYKVGRRLGDYTITAVYEYQDRNGRVVLRKARGELTDETGARIDKTFRIQSITPDGGWQNSEGIYGTLLYHLPDVLGGVKLGANLIIAEGEKDIDNLRAVGFNATCGLHGAGTLTSANTDLSGKWSEDHAKSFDGAEAVTVIADNDAAGEGLAQWICRSLSGRVKTLRLLRIADHCPELPKHGDFTDWVQLLKGRGVTTKSEIRTRLNEMIEATEPWQPGNIRQFPEEKHADKPEADGESGRKGKKPREKKDGGEAGDGGGEDYPPYHGSSMYRIKSGRLAVKQGDNTKVLCDFLPEPQEILLKDDGGAKRMEFVIAATRPDGTALDLARIEGADRFAAMRWPMDVWGHWGNIHTTIRNAAQMVLDAINGAGQQVSRHRTVYAHTGMRRIDGRMSYLYNGGAIGAESASVELPESLRKYSLESVPGVTREEAALSELLLLDSFPARIIYPMMAQAYLAPLYSVMESMQQPPSYVVLVVGESNAGKSTIAGYVLSHFGNFYNREFPASFEDSLNSARDKLFFVKDCLLVVDDYRKGASDSRVRNPHDLVANAIISAVADRSGRDRLNEKKDLSGARPCRGMCIMTGEDMPRLSPSRRLRVYRIDVMAGDIYKESAGELEGFRLTARAGHYRACMRAYIEELIARWDIIPEEMERRLSEAGERMVRMITRREGRLTECATHLMAGIGLMLDHLTACGVLDEEGREKRLTDAAEAIAANINVQGAAVDEEKPEEIWLATLRSLLATRSVTLSAPDEIGDGFRAGMIGYKKEAEYWIIPEAADEFICERLRKGGVTLDASRQSILRALVKSGKVIPQRRKGSDMGNPTTSVHLPNGRSGRVIRMPRWVLDDPDNPPDTSKMGFTSADSEQLPMEFGDEQK